MILVLFVLSLLKVSGQAIILEDIDPSEPFITVYLNLYDMNMESPAHTVEFLEALRNFEVNPLTLLNSQNYLEIVMGQIIFGFNSGHEFFINRSRRLLTRILNVNRNGRYIVNQIAMADLPEVIRAIFNHDNRMMLIMNSHRKVSNNVHFNKFERSQ